MSRAAAEQREQLVRIGKHEGKAALHEALAIKEAVFGKDDPTVAMTLYNMGNAEDGLATTSAPPSCTTHAYDIWSRSSAPSIRTP
jgi:hypothetical protein